jgi:pilus assembly protein FimV
MRYRPLLLSAAAALVLSAALSAAEVVVLRGGTRIELKKPWVRQGNNALLTRMDGTLLSVPVAEIDREATAVAQAAPALPPRSSEVVAEPASPAEAARAGRDRPKARVKVTDADVGHYVETPAGPGEASAEQKPEAPSGTGRLEIVDYTQERAGAQLHVRGSLRNAGGTSATSARLTISALNAQGQVFVTAEAGLSNGTVEPHRTVNFSASLPVGEQPVASLRFAPRWIAMAPPAPPQVAPASAPGTTTAGAEGAAGPAAASSEAAPAAPAAAAARPAPAAAKPPQTPYGQGVLYAAPPPSASFTAPADGKSGYIPGAANADQQPKPPQ